MTQPPLSRQIQMLEHALKVQLLLRTSRSVRLTPAGRAFLPDARRLLALHAGAVRAFLPDARRILALTEGAVSAAQRISKGECGLIRIGFTAGSSYSFLPRLLAQAKLEVKDGGMVLNEVGTMQRVE